jgi:hypothetical protein
MTQDVQYSDGFASLVYRWLFFTNTVHAILGIGGTKICIELFMKVQVFRHESSCIKTSNSVPKML